MSNRVARSAQLIGKGVAAVGLVGLVAACSGSGGAANNPYVFFAQLDRNTQVMSGQYNPAGYSGGLVKQFIGITCNNQRTASFTEAAQTTSKPSNRCRNSVTIYCKDPSSGAIIANATP